MREGHGSVQTWHRMKQLLLGRVLLSNYDQFFFFFLCLSKMYTW